MADGWPAGKELDYEPPPSDLKNVYKQYPPDMDFNEYEKCVKSDVENAIVEALTGIGLTEATAREAIESMRQKNVMFFLLRG